MDTMAVFERPAKKWPLKGTLHQSWVGLLEQRVGVGSWWSSIPGPLSDQLHVILTVPITNCMVLIIF